MARPVTKVLNVAEKPSMARQLSQTLSNGALATTNSSGGRGSGGTPVLSFQRDVHGLGHCEMTFTSTVGHLLELDFAPPYNEWSSCNPVDLFTAPVSWSVRKENEPIQRQLQQLARRASVLVLWLDCDREGEGIAVEVRDTCTAVNPRLRVLRARFSGVTSRELEHALAHLVPVDERMAHAVQARSELDLRLGAAFTRLQTMSLASRFDELAGLMVSYGPCQFPTLGFVAERYEAIQQFQPRQFWAIQVVHRHGGAATEATSAGPEEDGEDGETEDDTAAAAAAAPGSRGGRGRAAAAVRGRTRYSLGNDGRDGAAVGADKDVVTFTWERERVYDQLTALVFYENVVEAGAAQVVSVRGNEASRQKPLPMNSVEMLSMANRFLKIPTQEAANIAEQLYQQGYISYPRTETQTFEGIDTRGFVVEQMSHPTWGSYARRLIDGGEYEQPRAGTGNDHAHPPIHPLKMASPTELKSPQASRLFELICRHFLACCSRDARGSSTHVTIEMGGEYFTAHGTIIHARNFLDVYPYTKWTGKLLPEYRLGESFRPSGAFLRDGSTQPPELLAEYDLVHLMEASGIGTDATFAEHIHKIQARQYVIKNPQQRLVPSTLGWALIAAYNELNLDAMSKPYLRAQVEADLSAICDGRKMKTDVVHECMASMRPVYDLVVRNLEVLVGKMATSLHPIGSAMTDAPTLAEYGEMTGPDITPLPPAPTDRPAAATSRCGACGNWLVVRQAVRRDGDTGDREVTVAVLFCSACQRGWPLPKLTVRVEGTEHQCPLCKFQVVRVHRVGLDRVMFSTPLCPQCHAYPPAAYAPSAVRKDSSGKADLPPVGATMTCKKCMNMACKLAGGRPGRGATVAVRAGSAAFSCALHGCKGFMQLQRSPKGIRLQCDAAATAGLDHKTGCRHVMFLPQAATEAAVAMDDAGVCPRCSDVGRGLIVRKLDFVIRPGALPLDMYGTAPNSGGTRFNVRACVVCQYDDLEVIGLHEQPSRVCGADRAKAATSSSSAATVSRQTSAVSAAASAAQPVIEDFDDAGMLAVLSNDDFALESAPENAAAAAPDIEDVAGPLGGRFLAPLPKAKTSKPKSTTATSSKPYAHTPATSAAPAVASGSAGGRDLRPPPLCTMHQVPPVLRTSGPSAREPGAKFWVCPQRHMHQGGSTCTGYKYLGILSEEELRAVEDLAAHDSGASRAPAASAAATECYRCHQMGHFARDCPSVMDEGPNRKRPRGDAAPGPAAAAPRRTVADMKCGACGERGHTRRTCPLETGPAGY